MATTVALMIFAVPSQAVPVPWADGWTGSYATGIFFGADDDSYADTFAAGGLDTGVYGDSPWGFIDAFGIRCDDDHLVVREVWTSEIAYEETPLLEAAKLTAAGPLEGWFLRFDGCEDVGWDELIDEQEVSGLAIPASVAFTGTGDLVPVSFQQFGTVGNCALVAAGGGFQRTADAVVEIGAAAGIDISPMHPEHTMLYSETVAAAGVEGDACGAPAPGTREAVTAALARYAAR